MSRGNGPWIATAILGVAAVAVGAWFVFRPGGDENPLEVVEQPSEVQPSDGDSEGADPGYVMVGGVRRRATDVRPTKDKTADVSAEPLPEGYGSTPAVDPEANDQIKSIVKAVREGKDPERISVAFRGPAFDPDAYEADPQAYLDAISAGRVFNVLQPGPNVSRLRPVSERFQRIRQSESATLRVRAVPGAPVHFVSFDLGQFENGLTVTSVAADSSGLATARLTASTGTIEDVNVLAGSPVTSGLVKFIVNVEGPLEQ